MSKQDHENQDAKIAHTMAIVCYGLGILYYAVTIGSHAVHHIRLPSPIESPVSWLIGGIIGAVTFRLLIRGLLSRTRPLEPSEIAIISGGQQPILSPLIAGRFRKQLLMVDIGCRGLTWFMSFSTIVVGIVLFARSADPPKTSGSAHSRVELSRRRSKAEIRFLVAQFDEPNPSQRRVSDIIVSQLHNAFDSVQDTTVISTERIVHESEGSARARQLGNELDADIVVWGWCTESSTAGAVNVHVEVLRQAWNESNSKDSFIRGTGFGQFGRFGNVPVSELDSYQFQQDLSKDMVCLGMYFSALSKYYGGQPKPAALDLTQALRVSSNPRFTIGRDQLLFLRGCAFLAQAGEEQRAHRDFSEVLRLNPSNEKAYVNRAQASVRMGHIDNALLDLAAAIQREPRDADAYCSRGECYWDSANAPYWARETKFEESPYAGTCFIRPKLRPADRSRWNICLLRAANELSRAISIDPTHERALYIRGAVYADLGQNGKSIQDYNQLAKLDPMSAVPIIEVGRRLERLGRKRESIAQLSRAIDAFAPDGIDVRRSGNEGTDWTNGNGLSFAFSLRGKLYYELGDFTKAKADNTTAIKREPDFAAHYHNRALASMALGDFEAAKADLKQVAKLPDWFGSHRHIQAHVKKLAMLEHASLLDAAK